MTKRNNIIIENAFAHSYKVRREGGGEKLPLPATINTVVKQLL